MGESSSGLWDVLRGHPARTLMALDDFVPFVEGLDHPEGVACGPAGEIFAGGEAGQIYEVGLDGTLRQVGSTGGFILGLCLDADRNVYTCDSANRAVMRITPSGAVSVYSRGAPNRPFATPNYPEFDPKGNLYVADSGSWHGNNGCLFRVRPGGETELFSAAASAFPNGLAISPDGAHLYVALSELPGVVRIRLDGDAPADVPEHVVALPNQVPDGLAFDVEGNLFIACYAPSAIYRLTPAGDLDLLASDWQCTTLAAPTNIAFCGPARTTLVVASLARWHLAKAEMPIAGARLNYPRIDGGVEHA